MTKKIETLTEEQIEALKIFAAEVDCLATACLQMALEDVPKILSYMPTWYTEGARETAKTVRAFSTELENLVEFRANLAKSGFMLHASKS